MSAVRSFGWQRFGSPGIAPLSSGVPTAAYPGRVATNSDLIVAVDRQQTSLALALAASDTSMTVLSASAIVAYNLLSIDNEIVKTTGPAVGNVVPISRGFDGTTPAVHLPNAVVSGLIDAYHHNALVAEIEAIEQTLGPNLSQIPSISQIIVSNYDFPAQTPGGVLNPGTNSITLAPVPKGVNATNTNHYLWISGGTGTAEAVPITGGTAASGAASGVIYVTCAYAHSGAWTIRSSSSGLQESLWVAIANGSTTAGIVQIAGANALIKARVTIPAVGWVPSCRIQGIGGSAAPAIIRDPAYPAGDLIYKDEVGGSGSVYLEDLTIYNGGPYGTPVNTSGAAIHFKNVTGTALLISDVYIEGGYRGIEIESSKFVTVRNVYIMNPSWYINSFAGDSGIYIHDTGGTNAPTAVQILDSQIWGQDVANANSLNIGIRIESSDGIVLDGVYMGQIKNGVVFNAGSGRMFTGVEVANSILDTFQTDAIYAFGGAMSAISIYQNTIGTRADIFPAVPSKYGIHIDSNAPVQTLKIVNNNISFCGQSGVYINGAVKNAQILGNCIFNNNMLNVTNESGITFSNGAANASGIVIMGNQIANATAGHQKNALLISAQLDTVNIQGNFLSGETAPINFSAAVVPTNFILTNNNGIETLSSTVIASAATIAFPYYPFFTLTGNVGVTAVSGLWEGAKGSFIATNATPGTWTAGATIGQTFTPVSNALTKWEFRSGKIWLK